MPNKRDCECCDGLNSCIERGDLCPECHKGGFYYRKKTDDYRCPHCGNIWPKVNDQPLPPIEKIKDLDTARNEADIKVRNDIIVRFVQEYFSHVRNIPTITTIQIYKDDPHALVFFKPDMNIVVETEEDTGDGMTDQEPGTGSEESGMAGLGALFG